MKPSLRSGAVILAVFSAALLTQARAARVVPDIQPVDTRRTVVEKAERLARQPAPAALPEELGNPFSPPGFERGGSGDASRSDTRSSAPAAPQNDQELLASVAAKIPTTGTIILKGKPLLISGTNRIEAGSQFTVVYNGQEYELELVRIDRTTFTVRYKGEEFTRPIKLGKTP